MEHSTETLTSCPACGHDSVEFFLTCTDHTYSKDAFQLVKCTGCNLVFTNPRPGSASIGKYYDNPEYVSHTDTRSGLLFKLYGLVKSYTLKKKRRLLENLTTEKTILEYGAGSGDFCKELATNNWCVTAFEPDQSARQRILQKHSAISVVESLSQIPSASLSVITLWHVLEHVHHLNDTIKEFHRILKPQGKLIIAVPNHISFDAEYYGAAWAAYDVPRHLYHFTPEPLCQLIEMNDFRIKEMRPMWFDSFYVSLLSENNRNSKNLFKAVIGWPRAFLVGCASNVKALSDTRFSSSITYILEKNS